MAVEGKRWRAPKGFFGPVVSAAVLLAAVGGCSWVPDTITRAEPSRLGAQGLVSDREGRRYSSESIQRQSEPVEALAPRKEAAMPDTPAAPPPLVAAPLMAAPAAPPPAAPSVPMAAVSASPPAAAVAPPPVTVPPSSRVRETRQARPVRPPPAPKTPATEAKTAPAYKVQLAAVRSLESLKWTQGKWQRLRSKNLDLLGKLTLSVTKADLGPKKGVFYRLRAGPVADEAAARALCAKLARHKMGCLVVRPGA